MLLKKVVEIDVLDRLRVQKKKLFKASIFFPRARLVPL